MAVGKTQMRNSNSNSAVQHQRFLDGFIEGFIFQNVDVESMESMFTNEGHLVVRAKIKGSEDIPERTINITREGPPSGDKAGETKKE